MSMRVAERERPAEVLEREVAPRLPSVPTAGVDIQVATAKQFPRSIELFVRRCKEMATLTTEIASSCVYALPRDGKTIEGPSARLAEIVASAWGNLRIQAGTSDQDDRFITARGEAWDVETNVAIAFEVRRRITSSDKTDRSGKVIPGKTYSDDMITVTGNAAASIALRNAVFKAVPSAFWKPIYNECRKVIAGDAQTFHARRDETLKAFALMGVQKERLLASLGLAGVLDLKIDHMVTLTGIYNALKDGETTVEEAFPDTAGPIRPAQRVSTSEAQAAEPPPAAAAPAQAEAPAPADPVPAVMRESGHTVTVVPERQNVGVIVKVDLHDGGAATIELSTGFRAATRDPELIAAAKKREGTGVELELVTRASSDPRKYFPILEAIEEPVL